MIDGQTITIMIALVGMAAGGVWNLSRAESRLELSFQSAITKAKEDTEAHVDAQTRQFGETVAALKERVNLEITTLRKELTDEQKYIRDIFIRRDSFYKVLESLEGKFRELGTELKQRLDRLDEKIEKKM